MDEGGGWVGGWIVERRILCLGESAVYKFRAYHQHVHLVTHRERTLSLVPFSWTVTSVCWPTRSNWRETLWPPSSARSNGNYSYKHDTSPGSPNTRASAWCQHAPNYKVWCAIILQSYVLLFVSIPCIKSTTHITYINSISCMHEIHGTLFPLVVWYYDFLRSVIPQCSDHPFMRY